eukprot:Nk52_evm90s210 gene=Nk52_evmTU90s210
MGETKEVQEKKTSGKERKRENEDESSVKRTKMTVPETMEESKQLVKGESVTGTVAEERSCSMDVDESVESSPATGASGNTSEDPQEDLRVKMKEVASDEEVAACIKVLTVLSENEDLLRLDTNRKIRIQSEKIMKILQKARYGGKDPEEYQRERLLKMHKGSRKRWLRDMDKKRVEAAKLRNERMEMRQKLLEAVPTTAAIEDRKKEKNVDDSTENFLAKSDKESSAEQLKKAGVDESEVFFAKSCYICKTRFTKLHHFYDLLCPSCAELNYAKRLQMADLKGKVAYLSGSRVKIGYQCGLKLLRCGATLIASTRFPVDAARRYSQEKDFEEWKDNLHIYGLDMRDLVAVNRFADFVLSKFGKVDIVINNAAQTVRRPIVYYQHLLRAEMKPVSELPEAMRTVLKGDMHNLTCMAERKALHLDDQAPRVTPLQASSSATASCTADAKGKIREVVGDKFKDYDELGDYNLNTILVNESGDKGNLTAKEDAAQVSSAMLSQVPLDKEDIHYANDTKSKEMLFPEGKLDIDEQQIDLRKQNSWTMRIDEVGTPELLEVHCVNALAPFILNSKFIPNMMKDTAQDPKASKHIINVSAMEGKFYRYKTEMHPHTNMAKAASNMMTRTSAAGLAKSRIYMNSVDTGWITDENPLDKCVEVILEKNWQTPIDEVDAMARILDPVLSAYNTGECHFGQFFKDYRVSEW